MKKNYVTFELSVVTFDENDAMTASATFNEQGIDFGSYWGN